MKDYIVFGWTRHNVRVKARVATIEDTVGVFKNHKMEIVRQELWSSAGELLESTHYE
jgi:hypothetical protein